MDTPKLKNPSRLTKEERLVVDETWRAIERVRRIKKPIVRTVLASRLFGLLIADVKAGAS